MTDFRIEGVEILIACLIVRLEHVITHFWHTCLDVRVIDYFGCAIIHSLKFFTVLSNIPLSKLALKMAYCQWVDARDKFQAALELIDAEQRMKKTMWGQFWSAHQRFFKYLCISAKVNHCVLLARDAVRNNKVGVVQVMRKY